jgi:heptosyltransferase-3
VTGVDASHAHRRRALIVRAGALGDLLLLRRTIASLQKYGHSVSLLAPARPAQALLGSGVGDVDEIMDWDGSEVAALLSGGDPKPETLAARLARFDCAVVFSGEMSLRRALVALVPRVLSRDPKPPAGCHASLWYADILREIGVSPAAPPPCRATAAEYEKVLDLRRVLPDGFLAIHPGSGARRKNWPSGRFMQLVDSLSPDHAWLQVQGPAECEDLFPSSRGRVLARDLQLRALGCLLAQAGVFVGNDSGVTHLAAAWGAPTVALFGPTDPNLFAPLGNNVVVAQAPENNMESLSLAQALAAVEQARQVNRGESL